LTAQPTAKSNTAQPAAGNTAQPAAAKTAQPAPRNPAPRLVCVDLDGTLIKTDTLWESLLLWAKSRPWELLLAVLWLCRGRAHFKRQLAVRAVPDPALLPYRPQVLESLRELKNCGKTLLLVTAADERVARGVARHLGLFDEVIASDGATSCAGANKLLAIKRTLDREGFAYWGDSRADLPLW
jgi:phosphoserine phosphatase